MLPSSEYNENFLLKMLNDRSFKDVSDGPLLWVPLHAWRALAQMGSVSVIEPVLKLADEDDIPHAAFDFDRLCARLGEPAIEPLATVLADRARSETSRTLATQGLGAIGKSCTGATRARIVDALMNQVRNHPGDGWVNGAAAAALIVMDERSVAPELQRMYREGRLRGPVREQELIAWFGG